MLAQVLVAGPRRWPAALLLLFLLAAVAIGKRLSAGDCVGLIEFAAVLTVPLVLAHASVAEISSWRRAICRAALAAAVLALMVPLGFAYSRWFRQAPQVPKFVVENNHYDRILAIAQRVSRINPRETSQVNLGPTAVKTPATRELEALYAELQSLLAGTNAVEYDPERDDWIAYHLADLQKFRALGRCLEAEFAAARVQGEDGLATDYALATIQLGAMLQRGGLVMDALSGMALENVARQRLAELRGGLSPAKTADVQAVLAKIASNRESLEVQRARGTARMDGAPPLLSLNEFVGAEGGGDGWGPIEAAWQRCEASHRLLQADLGIRQSGSLRRCNGKETTRPGFRPRYADAAVRRHAVGRLRSTWRQFDDAETQPREW